MDKSKRVYVCGPMRGKANYNEAAFTTQRRILEDSGFTVCCPSHTARSLGFQKGNEPDIGYLLRMDLQVIDSCAHICLLNGWEESQGATVEVAWGLLTGVKFMDQDLNEIKPQDKPWHALQLTAEVLNVK